MHKHEKVTTYQKQPDGNIKITAKSYYDQLASVVEEIEKPHHNLSLDEARQITDNAINRIFTDASPQTIITIKKSKNGVKILERYTTLKQTFK